MLQLILSAMLCRVIDQNENEGCRNGLHGICLLAHLISKLLFPSTQVFDFIKFVFQALGVPVQRLVRAADSVSVGLHGVRHFTNSLVFGFSLFHFVQSIQYLILSPQFFIHEANL